MSIFNKFLDTLKMNDSYDDQDEFNDDETYDEDTDGEEVDDEEYEDSEPRKGLFSRIGERIGEWKEAKREKKRGKESAISDEEDEGAEDEAGTKRETYVFDPSPEDFPEDATEDEDSSQYEHRKPGFMKNKKKKKPKKEPEYDDWDDEDTYASYQKTPDVTSHPKVTPLNRKAGKQTMEPNAVQVIRPTSMEDSREIAEYLKANKTILLNLEGIDMDTAQRIMDFTCGTCYSLDGKLQKISNYVFILTPGEVDIAGDVTSLLGGNFEIPTMRSEY